MPFKMIDYLEAYKPATVDGLPVGEYISLGGILYMVCCPICSCCHEVKSGLGEGDTFLPTCLLKVTHRTVYEQWVQQYPEARDYTRVTLRPADPLIEIITPKKRGRKKAA